MTKLSPIGIEVGGPGSKPYKSIDHVIWNDIPPLAVLTGVNGSGKTQLLEILAHRLTDTWHNELGDLREVKVSVTGDTFGPDSIAFIPSRWNISGAPVLGIAQMQQVKLQLYESLRHHATRHSMTGRTKRARLERLLGVANLDSMPAEEFVNRLPDDFAFMLEEADVTGGLTHVFLAHRLRTAEALELGKSREDIKRELGPAPWEVLDEIFQAAEFSYRVSSPLATKLLDPYALMFEDAVTGTKVRPQDLSSGEQVLLGLVVWLYNSQHHGRFPRLSLMDEPDAHLHPSMTRHLLSVIKDVLVEKYDVRVILTTHSPSTVALAPDGSLFEMSRQAPRIVPSKSHAATVALLTSGLVTVSPSTRYVLVEDTDDVGFYGAVRDLLTDYGPSRDLRAIKPAPTIVFLPASTGSGKTKTGGGKSVVQAWIDKFDQEPLSELVRGIIDRDSGNAATARILVIGRYSIENYLLDPFVVFGLLLENGTAPTVPSLAISSGDEHRIRQLDSLMLQSILDVVGSHVEPFVLAGGNTIDGSRRPVHFTNKIVVQYPTWMLDLRGHDLLPLYQQAFGGSGLINPPRLLSTFRRVRLMPSELAEVLDQIQS